MTRCLVSGIGGFVGCHVMAHILHNTDWEIIGIDSFRHKGKTDRVAQEIEARPHWRSRVTILTHDLLAPISEQLDRRIGKIDYVLNIASESHVDRSIDDPRPFIENNVALMLTMLEWLRQHPEVEALIQCSTDETFGPAYETDHPESDPHRPSNPYSASKAAQEDICYAYWRTYNLPIMITNCMNMFGSFQDAEKFIPKIVRNILGDEPTTVHVSPGGVPGSRYYLHARNLADGMLFLLKNRVPVRYPADNLDRFNIVGSDEVNNIQMVEIISSMLGRGAKTEQVDYHTSRPGHDLRYGLDGTKMRELGWQLPISFEQSLRETVMWYVANPGWLQ